MATRIKIDNFPEINIKAKTQLDADAAAAATTITPQDKSEFATGDLVYVGNLGQEQTEKRAITISTNNFTVTALTYAHKRFEQLTAVLGDQLQVYRAANVDGSVPADSAFATVGSPFDLSPDQLSTGFVDSTGGSGYWYKWVFYNSSSSSEVTLLSDMQAIRGGDFNMYVSLEDVKDEAGFQDNRFITDGQVASYLAKACDRINTVLYGMYDVPFADPVPEVVQNIAKVLAAGYMLSAEYGVFAEGTNKSGQAKIMWADYEDANKPGQLQLIKMGRLELFDGQGNTLRIQQKVSGFPDDSTAGLAEFDDNGNRLGGGDSLFGISHKF